MNALALLCNLHAHGPTSLRRLRRAGIQTLARVAQLENEELAELLNGPPSLARRFAREAVALAARTAGTGEETCPSREEPIRTNDPAPEREAPAGDPVPAAQEALPDGESPAAPGEIEYVLPRPQYLSIPEAPQAEREPADLCAQATRDQALLLSPDLLRGLDEELHSRLVAQGIRNLRNLVDSTGILLARRLEVPLTRLLDLQYEAESLMSAAPTVPADEPEQALAEAIAPAPGVAGPFV